MDPLDGTFTKVGISGSNNSNLNSAQSWQNYLYWSIQLELPLKDNSDGSDGLNKACLKEKFFT